MPFWPENGEGMLCPLQCVLRHRGPESRYCSLWSFLMVKVVSPWEGTLFPFVTSKSLGGVGIFFKSPPSNSGVSLRMTEIHQDGGSLDVFVRKSYLDLEGVKVGVQLQSRKSETKVSWGKWSNFEICAARSYRLEMNPVWRNVPDWIEGSRKAWILVNHVCPGSVTFSPVLRAWELT